jgi:hypothetical protein
MAAAAGHGLGRNARPASYGLPLSGTVRVKPDADQNPLDRERGAGRDPSLCEIAERHGGHGRAVVACKGPFGPERCLSAALPPGPASLHDAIGDMKSSEEVR